MIGQRLDDWKRERLIKRLAAESRDLVLSGQRDKARVVAGLMLEECRNRSPQQIDRMERRRGLA